MILIFYLFLFPSFSFESYWPAHGINSSFLFFRFVGQRAHTCIFAFGWRFWNLSLRLRFLSFEDPFSSFGIKSSLLLITWQDHLSSVVIGWWTELIYDSLQQTITSIIIPFFFLLEFWWLRFLFRCGLFFLGCRLSLWFRWICKFLL